ncbi:MAG: mandelate racemase/muconate lactonizing enzyme family protein, partial [Bauldia sp.]|nr:mandelate racemase/muconate lactonizing enzyme family protein [Bauldia sp.]
YTTEGGWLHIDTDALVEDALQAKAVGFGGSKLKVGRPPKEDAKRLEAVRKAVGDNFEIMVDGNQGAKLDEAIRRARLYEPLDLAWYEEPLPAEDLGGHIRLSAVTTLPIAVGESIYSLSHFREYLQSDACSIVQADVARVGGITPWLKTAHLAEAFNVDICPHFLMELHVGLTAAIPNGRWVEYIPQLDSLTTEGMRIENGRAVPSNEPGLGIAWDWEAIDRRRVEGATRVVT